MPAANGFVCRGQAGNTHNRRHYGVDLVRDRDLKQRFRAAQYFGNFGSGKEGPKTVHIRCVLKDHDGRLKLLNLLRKELDIASGRERENTKAVGILANDIQRVGADRAGRTKNCERTGGHARRFYTPDHNMLTF